MNAALKDVIRTELRPRGFQGSFPHLRRRSPEQICLVTFQFRMAGGSFVTEVAECGPDGLEVPGWRHIPPQKVTAHHISYPRPRLGGSAFPVGDHWFVFGPREYEDGARVVHSAEHYAEIAAQVVRLIDEQAEPFWREQLRIRSSA